MTQPDDALDCPTQPETASHPRAHCLAAGRMFQAVGFVMFIGSSALWAVSGLILLPADRAAENWTDYLSGPMAGTALLTIDIVMTCVGGLGLFGAGMGLSNERRSAGRVGLIVTGMLATVFLSSAVVFALWAGAWIASFVTGVLGLLGVGLFLTAAHCASILRQYPPPMHNEATDEILEELRKKRDERRKRYDF